MEKAISAERRDNIRRKLGQIGSNLQLVLKIEYHDVTVLSFCP